MASLRPRPPFRELEEFRRNIDDMLEHLGGKTGYSIGSELAVMKPPMESYVEEGKLIVCAELPGIEPNDITVNVAGNVLTISASREEEHETKKRELSPSRVQVRSHSAFDYTAGGRENRRHQGKLQKWPASADHPNP